MVAQPSHAQPFRHFDHPSYAAGRIDRAQKHSIRGGNLCPICQSGDDDRRGRGTRCKMGWTSEDGAVAHCGRIASGRPDKNGVTFAHWLKGPCDCGEDHRTDASAPRPARPARPVQPNTGRIHEKYPPIATHEYRDADGALRFRVVRLYRGHAKPAHYPEGLPKTMPQRPDGSGDWYNGLEGMPYAGLYRLPELIAADPWEPVFVVGGELCADAVADAGGVATCNAGGEGAGKWRDDYGEHFQGRAVVILADADATGKEHAEAIADKLVSVAASVRVVTLEGAHDVADWLEAGHTFAQLRAIAAQATIITAQSLPSQNSSLAPELGNTVRTLKSCPQCAQLRDQLKRAEESLGRVRERINWHHRIMRLPKEKLSPALKPAAIAAYDLLKSPRLRDDQGREQVYRRTLASRCGVSDKTAGTQLRELAQAGIINRAVTSVGFHQSEIRISEGPLFATPEAIAERELAKRHGGKRERCAACGSENLETHIICRDCGSVANMGDTNKPAPEDDTPPESQNSSLAPELEQPRDDTPADATQPSDNFPPDIIFIGSQRRATGDDVSWIGGHVPGCEHPAEMRRTLKTGATVCGCGARYVPALDSAEVRTLTERSIG